MFKFIYRNIYFKLSLAIQTKINECLVGMAREWDMKTTMEKDVYDPNNKCGQTKEQFKKRQDEAVSHFLEQYRRIEIRKKTFDEMQTMIEFLKNG